MDKPAIKIGIALLVIILLVLAYFKYGNYLFDQTHAIDQEAEHSMTGITTIKIKDVSTDIVIHTADHRDFYATFQGVIKSESPNAVPILTAEQTDHVLDVEIQYSDYLIRTLKDMTFDVYLPKDYQFDLEILSEYGDITLSSMTLNHLSAITSSGDILIKASAIQSMVVSSISGNIDLSLTNDAKKALFVNSVSGIISSDYPVDDESQLKVITTSGNISIHHQ